MSENLFNSTPVRNPFDKTNLATHTMSYSLFKSTPAQNPFDKTNLATHTMSDSLFKSTPARNPIDGTNHERRDALIGKGIMASATLSREDSKFSASIGTDKTKLKYKETVGTEATLGMEHKSKNAFGGNTFTEYGLRSSNGPRGKSSGIFFGLGFTF